ncbi:hypothetical protein D9613_010336 [Agrocybe pediades]|uniref:Cytochrome P450 n=1 Tax=Agrocybe pediades TaxID=84607 RepID=A0A8H4VJB4_9AGAR|nr:hypothetical protein D9613_010336 [Agrocybe pediades]
MTMGYGGLMPFIPYGETWRERRKALVQHFRPTDTTVYQDTHIKFVREMLPRLLVDPEDFLSTIRHAIGGSALSMAYGLPIKQEDDPIIELAEKALSTLNASVLPTNFLVNSLPALQYLPEFLPGSGFKAKAREWKKLQEEMKSRPFDMVEQRMKNATAKPSFTSASLERVMHVVGGDESKLKHQQEVIKDTASAIFIGATDTTQVAVQIFILAMLCYPDVQKKAQAELDRVLGGRLPEPTDETDLPYITAVVKECLRWKPLAPIAVPHMTSKEDIYRGYYIPEGAIDERTYPNPTTVIPERFLKDGKLDPTVQDPVKILFGYGRRACPGTHIALSLLWLTVASILKTFDISKAIDDDGNVIEPSMEFHAGVVCSETYTND